MTLKEFSRKGGKAGTKAQNAARAANAIAAREARARKRKRKPGPK